MGPLDDTDMRRFNAVVALARERPETATAERLVSSGGGMKPWNRWNEKSTVTLENARAFLDEPGEWFLDRQQRLFYKPRPGESLESAELIALVCDELLTIRGEPAAGRFCDHVSFSGLAFRHARLLTPAGGVEPAQAAAPLGAVVTVTGTKCWWNTAGEPVRFLDKPLAEWQAAGHELGSIVADPLFVDPATRDYRLRPESPAIALGFKPYDWSQAGVVGDPTWVARAREGWEAPASQP
jgi:hypothetical protein